MLAKASSGTAPGWAQAERPIGVGDRFLVRLKQDGGADRQTCNAWIGLAPKGSRVKEAEDAVSFGGSVDSGARSRPGGFKAGDLVECGLLDDGSGTVYWRVNSGPLVTSPQPLATAQLVYPTVELSEGCRGVELLTVPLGQASDAGPGRWAEAPSIMGAGQPGKGDRDRPLLIFLGLGFLLGKSLDIDTVASRALFT
eukprot:TRINITY_DN28636_c0_g1_i1.p1 TRINITY_DN28636_c0_g1~~TRINITY_DN28636_c0_g1_i1.p1  ORF type:complete len:212 (-),score=30.01 TRINITY_DN28636_c0_g1_i1:83-673(-)